jgi:hypothetical protein
LRRFSRPMLLGLSCCLATPSMAEEPESSIRSEVEELKRIVHQQSRLLESQNREMESLRNELGQV